MAKRDTSAILYDYEGNLIEKAPLKRKTLPEVEELVDQLTKKVQENPENEMYQVYLNNAQRVLFSLYNSMSKEDLMSRISLLQNSIENAKEEAQEAEKEQLNKVNEALDELKEEYVNYEEIPAEDGKEQV